MKGQYQNNKQNLMSLRESMYENIFKLYDVDNYPTYNILQQVSIPENLDESVFSSIETQPSMTLSVLSHRLYNTMDLWWLICIVNRIDNPIELLPPGVTLKIIKPQYVSQVLTSIKSQLT